MYEDRPVGIELPLNVEMTVVETEPVHQGRVGLQQASPPRWRRASSVQVPAFVSEGERIKIDTSTGSYVERVK